MIENNIRKAYSWAYVESLVKGLYGEESTLVMRELMGKPIGETAAKCQNDFLEMVWGRVNIVEQVAHSVGRHKHNLIGAYHAVDTLPDGWLNHQFLYVDATGEKIEREDFSFIIPAASQIKNVDQVHLHRKLFDLFRLVTGDDILMKRIYLLEQYILESNNAGFDSESQSQIDEL